MRELFKRKTQFRLRDDKLELGRQGSLCTAGPVRVIALAGLLAATCGFAASVGAATGNGGGTVPFATAYFEQGNLVRAGDVVQALGPNLMGDSVNEYNGSLEFAHTDVSLPGNFALPVMIGRRLATATSQPGLAGGLFGDWELDIPHLQTIAGGTYVAGTGGQSPSQWYGFNPQASYDLNRCSHFAMPPAIQGASGGSQTYVQPGSWWGGYHMSIPGSGDQTLLGRAASATPVIQPSDGVTYPVLTKANWQLSCLPSLANESGEGFVAHGPDGTRYQFDHLARRSYPFYQAISDGTQVTAGRTEIWIMPSQVTDRFGNTVTYSYDTTDPWKLLSITSSDARTISLTYVPGTHRVQTVSDGTRTWTYSYNSDGTLLSVTLPDASAWQFALQPLEHATPLSSVDPGCGNGNFDLSILDPNVHTGTIVHPSGATGSFSHQLVWHGTSNVPGSFNGCGVTNKVPLYAVNYSLTAKTLSGPGMPAMTWTYGYSAPNGSFAPVAGNVVTKTISITDPQGNVSQNSYGTQYGLTEGLLVASAEGVSSNGSLRTSTYTYAAPNAGPYPPIVGYFNTAGDAMSAVWTPLIQRIINQQSTTFTQTVAGFDIYARSTGESKSSSLGYSKSDTTTYYDNTNLWVLGQVAATATNGVQTTSTNFSAATALPSATYSFGKLKASYVFNGDGTLSTLTDGLNHATSFSNYVRGLAQHIGFPDGSAMNGVVNNIGTLNSVTNEAGTTWTFAYDAMGRLSGKIPPAGDAVTYNPTTYSFVQVPSAEYGLEPNHWRQSIAQGNAVTVNYFDARWRKRLSITYDANDPSSTQRAQRYDYDPYNRQVFASYPARSIASITTSMPGTATTYDALGRITQTQADSELGTLTTSAQYLAGFQKQVTNARGFATTTGYQAFDEPSESAPVSIAAPEGVTVTIARDAYDKPVAITRGGGGGASVTRSYVYDGNQLLCKTIEPEIGATVQSLDAANNVAWRATGLNLASTSSCDTGSVPPANRVSYSYDARNRLLSTNFADGSPAIVRTYTADGLPSTIASNNSTWSYSYNNRRLPLRESLNLGSTYNIDWAYDANAHVYQLSYPDSSTVSYNPNALGEATQVSGYASGVTYQPNGAVASYTLANGTVHSQSQNVRGLPLINSDSGVLQDQYSYDANGNITAILDQQTGTASRSMGYDGMDRLTAANAPGIWGNASYGYDTLDNIRTSVVGNRNAVHNYDTSNRLSSININGAYTGYAYDAQGNVTGRGTQGFSFDQGNRMTLANGVASYAYDGLGRRTSINGSDGSNRLQVYDQAGQLLYGTSQQGAVATSTRYVYLGGKLIAETDGSSGSTVYTHTDALGSPVATVGPMPAVVTYTCPSGWTLAGTQCTQGTSSSVSATVAGYNCPSGYTLSGSTCSQTTGSSSAATANYSCPSGWSLSGTTCTSTTSSAATPIYSCPSGYTLSGSTCSGTATTAASSTLNCNGHGSLQAYNGSPTGYKCTTQGINTKLYDDPYGQCQNVAATMGLPLVGTSVSGSVMTCVMGPVQTYSCPAGQTLSGNTCKSTVTQAANVSGYSCSSGTLSGSSCVVTNTSAASVSYSCPAGQTLSGTTCTSTTTTTAPGTPYYSCPSGYALSGTTCTTQGTATSNATAVFSCPSGGTLSGSTCQGVVTRTVYEAYGNTAAGSAPGGIGFTGHVNDASTGLVYMQQRYYDPLAARFLSVDPVAPDGNTGRSFNVYRYANNNPYRYTDPDGRDPWYKEPRTVQLENVTVKANKAASTIGIPVMLGIRGSTVISGVAANPYAIAVLLAGFPSSLGAVDCEMPGASPCGMRSEGEVKPDREQRPDDVPTGTVPVDQDRRLDREKIHGIKDQIGAGARDWVGIDPSGNIWTNEAGNGANQGHYTDYINSGKGRGR